MRHWLQQSSWRVRACLLLPFLAGLVALAKGQDGNWDLRNYHLYNPWAWLNDRLTTDLAPAGLQSYFNPLIDLPYFFMIQWLPGPLVGFLLGVLHGLVAIPLFVCCRLCLDEETDADRKAFWLTVAGLLGIVTLAGVGNTMGDHLTALPVMAAAAMLLKRHPVGGGPSLAVLLVAGGLLGLAVGLKLTNAIYVAGACGALLVAFSARFPRRLIAATIVGCTSVAVFALIAGPWHWQLWQEFGNPLFPQFNAWFQSPLAPETMVADRRWQPDGWLETAIWPLLIAVDPSRAGDKPLPQIVFAVLFILFLLWPIARVLTRRAEQPVPAVSPQQAFVLGFIGIAFVLWTLLFGVYRYLVPLELVAPLAIWILAPRAWPHPGAQRLRFWLVVAVVAYAVANFTTWGTRPWAMQTVRVESPSLESPSETAFILTTGEPMSWLIPWLPRESAYVGLGRMSETDAYVERARHILARHDSIRVLVYTHKRLGASRVARFNERLSSWGIERADALCGALATAAEFSSSIEIDDAADQPNATCRFDYVKYTPADLARMNESTLQRVADTLSGYGLEVERAACRQFDARLGGEAEPYRLCPVSFAR
ncbi:MAG: hypothetical protein U5L08_06895 [Xanthomonadales bacterium]|nr:hypothetical protein [Xanthomonadales bacterium]